MVKEFTCWSFDVDSIGALLLFDKRWQTTGFTHPHSIPKTYHVWVEMDIRQNRYGGQQGVILEGRKHFHSAQVQIISRCTDKTCLEIILSRGRNRQPTNFAQ